MHARTLARHMPELHSYMLTYSFDMLLQLGESSLQELQAVVQQEAGILLDRQRITVEGMQISCPDAYMHHAVMSSM